MSNRPALFAPLAAVLLTLPAAAAAGAMDEAIKAFERNKSYVQPVATLFGSMTNSGWYQSAGVPRKFGFYLGLPLNMSYIADADRSYAATFTDEGCQAYQAKNPGSSACQATTGYDSPTLLGRDPAPTLTNSNFDPDNNSVYPAMTIPVNDGIAEVADFNWFPVGSPQLSFNYYFTELKLRYIGAPLPYVSFQMPGVGIQHDLASFLPPLPVSLSLAGNMTWLMADFEPGQNIDGTLELTGFSHFLGLLVGYNYRGFAEIFLETGWEGASLHSGGKLVIRGDSTTADETIKPNLDIQGRNAFRAGISVAMHFGYQAVLGQNFGSNLGHNVNVLGYRFKSK